MANKTIDQLTQIDSLAGGNELPIYDESTGTTKKTTVNQINDFVADGAITDAINALNVSGVGGSGKYIAGISETDGKINATEGTIDDTVTEESGNPVTSGAVASALKVPSDAVVHYSFDEIPDYPDGTAVKRNLNGDTYAVDVGSAGTITTDAYAEDGKIHKSNVNGNANYKTNVGSNRNLGIYFGVTSGTGLVKIIEFNAKTPNLDVHIFYRQTSSSQRETIYPLGNSISIGKHRIAVFVPQDCFEYSIVFYSYASDLNYTEWELTGYYLGNGSYITPIIDNSGNGNNATNNGVVAVQGVCGKGVYCFQTSRKYIDLGNKSLTPNFSISMWINSKSNDASTLGILLYKQNQILLRNGMQWSQYLALYLYGENGTLLSAQNIGDLLPLNEWCHLVITREGTTLKVYRNGVLTHTVTLADGTLATNNNNMTLLGYNSSDTMRECLADDLLIFDRALSEEEVTALYLNKANTPKYYDINNYKLTGIPTPPAADGNYVLVANISSGVLTYSWVAQS